MIVVKTLEEIITKKEDSILQISGLNLVVKDPKMFALEIAKEIRKLTLEEIANTAEVTVVDFQYMDDSNSAIWGVDSDSILKLDLEKIQTW